MHPILEKLHELKDHPEWDCDEWEAAYVIQGFVEEANRAGCPVKAAYRYFQGERLIPIDAAIITVGQILAWYERDKWLTVKEAAARLNISERTIYDLCREGRIEHVRAGGYRIHPALIVREPRKYLHL